MKLFQTVFNTEFEKTVKSWAETINSNGYSALIHVYIPYAAEFRSEDTRRIRQILKKEWKPLSRPTKNRGAVRQGENEA